MIANTLNEFANKRGIYPCYLKMQRRHGLDDR